MTLALGGTVVELSHIECFHPRTAKISSPANGNDQFSQFTLILVYCCHYISVNHFMDNNDILRCVKPAGKKTFFCGGII